MLAAEASEELIEELIALRSIYLVLLSARERK
jgi:hypothetical protein